MIWQCRYGHLHDWEEDCDLGAVRIGGGVADYVIKDSGERKQFAGGMVRDTAEGKTNWALISDGPMMERWAVHLTKGAKKYEARNWMKGQGKEEYDRAKESAFRHFMQWFNGDSDEDHAAAVYFNINQAEYLKGKMNGNPVRTTQAITGTDS